MEDFANLFQAKMLSGEEHRYRHFEHARLAASGNSITNEDMDLGKQLIITHSNREDIIYSTLEKHRIYRQKNPGKDLAGGIILAGKTPPKEKIIQEAMKLSLPIIYAPMSSYKAMKKIVSFIGKIKNEDTHKVKKAIDLVEKHIDFDALLRSSST